MSLLPSKLPTSGTKGGTTSQNFTGDYLWLIGVAQAHHFDVQYLVGIWGVESGYGANTNTSSAGAIGPFQLERSTAQQYGGGNVDANLVDSPNLNQWLWQANAAANYLHHLFLISNGDGKWSNRQSQANQLAISRYNAGPNGAFQSQYVADVLKAGGVSAWSYPGFSFGNLFNNLESVPGVSSLANPVASTYNGASSVFSWLSDPTNLLRIGKIIFGAGLVFIAVNQMIKSGGNQGINITETVLPQRAQESSVIYNSKQGQTRVTHRTEKKALRRKKSRSTTVERLNS